MPLFSKIQRYILKECLQGLALVLGILLLAILMIDVVEQLRTVGGDVRLSILGALKLSLMKLPQIVEQTLPFALLIASMMAFTRLNRRSELSIIRASGISAWRFLTPVMVLGVVLGLFTMMVLNPFAAKLSESFEQTRDRLLNEGRPTITLRVENTGDRPVQVGSHYHFYETNMALSFEREKTRGFRLNIASGTAVRFEPGQGREVELVAYVGDRKVYGFRGDVMGSLDGESA